MTTAADDQTRPDVVVVTDTDLLVMLTVQVTAGMDLHMLFGFDPISVYSIQEIQQFIISTVKAHLMFIHAITGCDIVSARYNMGEKEGMGHFW